MTELLRAYTDGSFNKEEAHWAFIIVDDDNIIHEEFGVVEEAVYKKHCQVAGEIYGALNATNYAIRNNCKTIEINYDFEGVKCWITGDWQAKIPLTKWYRKTMAEYQKLIDIKFVKVTAHADDRFNNYVDELTRKSING